MAEPVDPFTDEKIADIWIATTDIVEDPTVAKEVMKMLARQFWNLDWETWQRLATVEA